MNHVPVPAAASHCPRVNTPERFFSDWYAAEGRRFPWRDDNVSPFGILVAEILLKQTRATHVARVWPELMSLYPTADKLAMANPAELCDIIAVLGFGNQRTSALLDLSAAVSQLGRVPADPGELITLPYVGLYTSHAVACFGFNRRVPAVDTNVVRVISRLAGLEAPSDIRRATDIWEIAWNMLPERLVKEHNYGLLDFSAAICRSRVPHCSKCPIAIACDYGRRRAAPQ